MSPYMTDQRGRQMRAGAPLPPQRDLGAAASAAASLPRRDGVASSPTGVATLERLLMPSKRDIEVADELQRAARMYHDRARLCVTMAENLLLGRPMAHGIGRPVVHSLTDEPGGGLPDGSPPAAGHEMNKPVRGVVP